MSAAAFAEPPSWGSRRACPQGVGGLTAGRATLRSVQTTIRRLSEDDLEAVVALSLAAWAPVFSSLEGQLGRAVYRLLYPDWRVSQAGAVRAVCTAPEN